MLFFCVSSRTSTNDKEINSNKTGRVVAEMPQRDPNLVTPTGLSQWLSGEESACNAEATGSIPGVERSPEAGDGQVTLVLMPGKFHGQRSPAGYGPYGGKESDQTEVTACTHAAVLWATAHNTALVSAQYFYRDKISVTWLVTGSR